MTKAEAIDNFRFFNEGDYITREMEESADIVLNLIQTQQEEIERLKCNREILQGELDRIGTKALKLEAGSSTDDVIAEIEKKDKVIDLMTEEIVEYNLIVDKEYPNEAVGIFENIEDAKEHFINEVEKEIK